MHNRFLHLSGRVLFWLLTVLVLAATFIPLLPSKQWYVRIFDYPRFQTLIVAVIALALYVLLYFKRQKKNYFFVLLFVVIIVVQGYKAWPYTPLGTKQVLNAGTATEKNRAISLFICNVLQTNTAYGQVLQEVNSFDPDVLITTETDSTWQNELSVLENKYPFRIAVPQSNTYGMHLYSRLPLRESAVRYLLEPDIPSIRTGIQLPSGEWVTLFVVHPRPPVPTEADDSKERDAEIIMVAREGRRLKSGVIVAGDFNDVAWSETTELFQKVSGYLDPRRGRGFYNTFHAKYPFFRWPLDHIFHSPHFRLINIERVGPVNSDHFPMYIKLTYKPEEKEAQPAVKPDANTHKKANETIREGKTDNDAPR